LIIPPIGGLNGLAGQLGGAGAGAAPTAGLPAETPVAGAGEAGLTNVGAGADASGGTPSFGNELTDAISSLEQSQQSASAASQSLASGTVKDPEAAVTTVEDAALTMQLASTIRTKATEAAQTIFQTQV
jgi:flagellar hook-basal body complex protein FliE